MMARRNKAAWRRSAFTLMELMVSVAILLAVLALIGTIFSTTSKAGGNATAMSILHRQLGQVAELIERDLTYTSPGPGGTMLSIVGKTIPVYETAKEKDLGLLPTLHRADILIFTTTAAQDPYIYEDPATLDQLAQVVYGHADFARFNPNTQQIDLTNLEQIEDVQIPAAQRRPASQWHLARRVIRFLAGNRPYPAPKGALDFTGNAILLTDPRFLTGECEVLWQPVSDFTTLFPDPGLLQFLGTQIQSAPLYPAPTCFGPYLLDRGNVFALSSIDNYWWVANGGTWYRGEYNPVTGNVEPASGYPQVSTSPSLVRYNHLRRNLLYYFDGPTGAPRRSIIDPKPPLDIPNPMRWNFLPGCSEFKVEYTYDDPRELRLNPDLSVNLLPQPVRWHSVPPEGQIIWSNLSVTPTDRTDPRRWPRALRITLRVWDPNGRLTDPVTRTIVHTW